MSTKNLNWAAYAPEFAKISKPDQEDTAAAVEILQADRVRYTAELVALGCTIPACPPFDSRDLIETQEVLSTYIPALQATLAIGHREVVARAATKAAIIPQAKPTPVAQVKAAPVKLNLTQRALAALAAKKFTATKAV